MTRAEVARNASETGFQSRTSASRATRTDAQTFVRALRVPLVTNGLSEDPTPEDARLLRQ